MLLTMVETASSSLRLCDLPAFVALGLLWRSMPAVKLSSSDALNRLLMIEDKNDISGYPRAE